MGEMRRPESVVSAVLFQFRKAIPKATAEFLQISHLVGLRQIEAMQTRRLHRDVFSFGNAMCARDLSLV